MRSDVSYPRGLDAPAAVVPRVITASGVIGEPGESVILDGAVVLKSGLVAWVGPSAGLLERYATLGRWPSTPPRRFSRGWWRPT